MANIYIWHDGERACEIATEAELAEFGKFSPLFEVWSLQAAIEAIHDCPGVPAPRTAKIAKTILVRWANRGSERAARALRELDRSNYVV